MTGFGEQVRAERERRGLTLEDVSRETRLALHHLQAVEQESYGTLPGGVFRKGIVRAYVGSVGLAEAEWMERFQASYEAYARTSGETSEAEGWEAFAENVKRGRTPASRSNPLRWLGVLLMLVLLGAAGWAVWRYMLQR